MSLVVLESIVSNSMSYFARKLKECYKLMYSKIKFGNPFPNFLTTRVNLRSVSYRGLFI